MLIKLPQSGNFLSCDFYVIYRNVLVALGSYPDFFKQLNQFFPPKHGLQVEAEIYKLLPKVHKLQQLC